MEASRPTQAEGIVTLVGPEHLQALIAISPTPNARPVALDITNPLEDRTTATAHVAQARSRREAPLHAHPAVRDMLNHYQHKETATPHAQQANIHLEAPLHARHARRTQTRL
jgi:hypothetical protein